MITCMRTTLNLPDALMDEVRAQAVAQGRTVTSLVVEGLRTVLGSSQSSVDRTPSLPAYGNPNGRSLVDLTDRDAVWAALDADGIR
jgi:hypothetical protein